MWSTKAPRLSTGLWDHCQPSDTCWACWFIPSGVTRHWPCKYGLTKCREIPSLFGVFTNSLSLNLGSPWTVSMASFSLLLHISAGGMLIGISPRPFIPFPGIPEMIMHAFVWYSPVMFSYSFLSSFLVPLGLVVTAPLQTILKRRDLRRKVL